MKLTDNPGSMAEQVLTWRHKSLVEGIIFFFGGMRGKMRDPE